MPCNYLSSLKVSRTRTDLGSEKMPGGSPAWPAASPRGPGLAGDFRLWLCLVSTFLNLGPQPTEVPLGLAGFGGPKFTSHGVTQQCDTRFPVTDVQPACGEGHRLSVFPTQDS